MTAATEVATDEELRTRVIALREETVELYMAYAKRRASELGVSLYGWELFNDPAPRPIERALLHAGRLLEGVTR
jgi:hypothetical protein